MNVQAIWWILAIIVIIAIVWYIVAQQTSTSTESTVNNMSPVNVSTTTMPDTSDSSDTGTSQFEQQGS